jgi:hypothetical protein
MTYEELMALEASTRGGMTPEEIARRQQLIANVAQHNPELAIQIAKGPYRMNGSSPTPSAPTQGNGTYSAPPPQGQQYQPVHPGNNPAYPAPSSAPAGDSSNLMKSPTINAQGQQVPTYGQMGPTNAQGNYGGPPQGMGNPRYDFPQNATGSQQQPVVNINVGASPAGFSRQGYGSEPTNWSQAPAPGQPAGFSRQGYGSEPTAWVPPVVGGPQAAQQAERDYWGYGNTAPPTQPPVTIPGWNPNSKPADFGMNYPSLEELLWGPPGAAQAESNYWGYGQPAQPGLTAADFGPAQPMFDLGIRRPLSPVQMVTPLNSSIGGTLSR